MFLKNTKLLTIIYNRFSVSLHILSHFTDVHWSIHRVQKKVVHYILHSAFLLVPQIRLLLTTVRAYKLYLLTYLRTFVFEHILTTTVW